MDAQSEGWWGGVSDRMKRGWEPIEMLRNWFPFLPKLLRGRKFPALPLH